MSVYSSLALWKPSTTIERRYWCPRCMIIAGQHCDLSWTKTIRREKYKLVVSNLWKKFDGKTRSHQESDDWMESIFRSRLDPSGSCGDWEWKRNILIRTTAQIPQLRELSCRPNQWTKKCTQCYTFLEEGIRRGIKYYYTKANQDKCLLTSHKRIKVSHKAVTSGRTLSYHPPRSNNNNPNKTNIFITEILCAVLINKYHLGECPVVTPQWERSQRQPLDSAQCRNLWTWCS